MLFLLWYLCLTVPEPSISSDGYNLTITGDGIVTKEIARSKGNYQQIRYVNITAATELAKECFLEFSMLENIFLPERLSGIGENCFMRCFNLKSLTIPEGVTELKMDTFYRCNSIEEVTIPSTLEKLYDGEIFYQNYVLKKYYVHGDNSFFTTDSTNSYLMSLDKTVLYKGPSDSDQVIPKTVKRIRSYYSRACNIISISFEGSILEDIDSSGFVAESVDTLKFPNTMKYIRNSFFSGTVNTIIIPDSVISFHPNALDGISNLKELQIGTNSSVLFKDSNGVISNIEKTIVFFVPNNIADFKLDCNIDSILQSTVKKHSIESIEVIGTPKKYSSFYGVLYQSNGLSLYACPGGKREVRIVENCTSIMSHSFSGCLVETIIMSDSVKTIGFESLQQCINLQSLAIPANLEMIYGYALDSCTKLSITGKFPQCFKTLSESSFKSCNFDCADFSLCVNLTKIPNYCFQHNSLREIILPPNIESICKQSFENCSKLESITLPSTLTLLDVSSFFNCSSLANVTFKPRSPEEKGIDTIYDSVFGNSGITSIVVPSSVITISSSAFINCENLELISFEKDSQLKKIKYGIVKGCNLLEQFEVPYLVDEIEAGAFVGAYDLRKIIVSKDNQMFEDINGILFFREKKILHSFPGGRESGTIEDYVISIYKMAFQDCVNLKNVVFENGCQIISIGEYTFSGCLKLSSIILPGSIATIEANGFSGCRSLANVTFGENSNLSVLSKSVFADCTNLERVIFIGESNLKTIGKEALKNCNLLQRFDIQWNVETIEASAFEDCLNLKHVDLPNVMIIENKAFYGCKSLTNIAISKSMKSLGDFCFGNCLNLHCIFICNPDDLKIAQNCFVSIKEDAKILIPIASSINTICGIQTMKILDFECFIPTSMFTQEGFNKPSSVFLECIGALSLTLNEEGK